MQPENPLINRTLGHYEVASLLGKGGMGEVYRAHDSSLGRDVALKVLPADLADDEARLARFEHEARTLARLNHPNIVTIHSVEEAGGTRFLTMELMEGHTLDACFDGTNLDLDRLLDLTIPIARAVAAAHEKGVVHRDLKPANVMVNKENHVKVLDFGLAKLEGVIAEDDATAETVDAPLTEDGGVVGTVAYMSPEQARGDEVDQRSDIFSLGVMMYEMASGTHPFKGRTSADTLSSILRDEPASITEGRPDLPNHLGRIVRRCLAKEPKERLQSARDLVNDLEGLRQESSSSPTSTTVVTGRVEPASGSKKLWRTITTIVAAVVIAAIGAAVWMGRPPAAPPSRQEPETRLIVVFPFNNLGAPEDAYFASGMADEISSRLARVESLRMISRTSAVQYDRTGKTMRDIAKDLGVDYVLEGTVRWSPGDGDQSRIRITPNLIDVTRDEQIWSASYDETLEEVFAVQSRVALQVISELDLTLGEGASTAIQARPTQNLDAYRAYLRGIETRDRDYYSPQHRLETIALFEQAVELDPDFALAWAALSHEHSYFYHLRYDTTDDRRKSARAAVDRALALDPDLPEAHLALGYYHYRCYRDYAKALDEFSIVQSALPNDADLMTAIGAVHRRLGDFEKAAEISEHAILLKPMDSTILWDLGVTYGCMGRWSKAINRAEESIAVAPDESVGYGIKMTFIWMARGDVAATKAIFDSMPGVDSEFRTFIGYEQLVFERDYDRALDLVRRHRGPAIEHTTIHWPVGLMMGDLHRLKGEPERARASYEEALSSIERSLRDRGDDARIHAAHGEILARLGRSSEAIAAGRHAVELYPTSLDAFHGPHIEQILAYTYLEAGEIDAGFDLLAKLLNGPQKLVVTVPLLEIDPRMDGLRDHPRYRELVRKFGDGS